MTAAITVSDLTRTYGTKKQSFSAVNGISFEVREGEVYGLLGTNGAGKTSTLDILEGLVAPTSGTVRVLGFDPIADRAKVRRHTGIMLQDGGLPSALTTRETLEMWAGTCSTPAPIDDTLELVDLAHKANTKVGALSGGEQRRLDLACALVGQPTVLFLDEPTTGLDPESRRNVWNLLRDLKRQGVTMVLTTHYLEEAEALCDRLCIMHRGEMAVEGTLSEVAARADSLISFDTDGAYVPELPGTDTIRDLSTVTIRTSRLQRDTLALLEWAHDNGVELKDFSARSASLEQVFIDIAGTPTYA